MRVQRDLREFIELLNSESVEYAIIGCGERVQCARPWYARDVNILIRATPANSARLETAVQRFGLGFPQTTASDFLAAGKFTVETIADVMEIPVDKVWELLEPGELDGIPVFFFRGVGRPQIDELLD
jgi:hypothetical protein